jgi:hypothetical protein
MSGWREIATLAAVIVPILLPLFVPVISGLLSNFISDVPKLEMSFLTTNNGTHGNPTIKLYNLGKSPATNLTIHIIAPGNVLKIKDNFSNIQTSAPTFNGSMIKMFVPKLVQGGGAWVGLSPLVKLQNSTNFYSGYLVYDQGSGSYDSFRNPELKSSQEILNYSLLTFFTTAWFWLIYTVGYVALLIIIFRRLKKWLISWFKKDSIQVYETLKENIASESILPYIWFPFLSKRNLKLRKKSASRFFDISDYFMIEEFYRELDRRNNVIENRNQNDIPLTRINQECLKLSEQCLKNIEWKKYL